MEYNDFLKLDTLAYIKNFSQTDIGKTVSDFVQQYSKEAGRKRVM